MGQIGVSLRRRWRRCWCFYYCSCYCCGCCCRCCFLLSFCCQRLAQIGVSLRRRLDEEYPSLPTVIAGSSSRNILCFVVLFQGSATLSERLIDVSCGTCQLWVKRYEA